jgi:hypothetical protein
LRQVLVVFFGRTTDNFTNTFARVFGLVLRVGAAVFRRRLRRRLPRLFAHLLRPGSVSGVVRYCFVFLTVFVFCLLNKQLLKSDTEV